MATYYTYTNFLAYSLSLVVLVTASLLAELTRPSRVVLWRVGWYTGCGAVMCMVLSRTCPYPRAKPILVYTGILLSLAALAIVLINLFLARREKSNHQPSQTRLLDRLGFCRWIIDAQRDRIIIIDGQNRILDWGSLDIDGQGPFPGDRLGDLIQRLKRHANLRELVQVLEQVEAGQLPKGSLEWESSHYHYWTSQIDGSHPSARLLAFIDLSHEYQLSLELESQNSQLESINLRLASNQNLERRLAQEQVHQDLDQLVRDSLDHKLVILEEELRQHQSDIDQADIQRLTEVAQKSIAEIRRHVHNLSYTREAGPCS